jgi:hypothetical protein
MPTANEKAPGGVQETAQLVAAALKRVAETGHAAQRLTVYEDSRPMDTASKHDGSVK